MTAVKDAVADSGVDPAHIKVAFTAACGLPELDEREVEALDHWASTAGATLERIPYQRNTGALSGASAAVGICAAVQWLQDHDGPVVVVAFDPGGSAAAFVLE